MWAATVPPIVGALEARLKASKSGDDEAEALFLVTEAFTYKAASKSIIKAIVGGDALQFNNYVDEMVRKYPSYDNGLAHIYRGAFFLAAPWPVYSPKKAQKHFLDALAVDPQSHRALYYAGVGAYYCKRYKEATGYFEKAACKSSSTATTTSEKDCEVYIRDESKRAMEVCRGLKE